MTTLVDSVLGFDRLGRGDVSFAGGKGANLGELTAAGLPVPPGFVIGAPAYAAFCDDTGLRDRIAARLADLDVEDTAALQRASEEVRAEIEREPVPEWLAKRILGAYEDLVGGRLRGAGRGPLLRHRRGQRVGLLRRDERDPAERLRGRGRAGRRPRLLVLPLRRPDDLLPRQARLRPGRHGHRGRRPAADPVDPLGGDVHDRPRERRPRPAGDRGRLRARGGGRLRLGLARPLRRPQGRAGDRPARSPAQGAGDRLAAGGRDRDPRARRGGGDAAGLERCGGAEVAGLGVRIEDHYGSPQDTEWAFDSEGNVWMLQSRPVTTIGGGAEAPGAASAAKSWSAASARRREKQAARSASSPSASRPAICGRARSWSPT